VSTERSSKGETNVIHSLISHRRFLSRILITIAGVLTLVAFASGNSLAQQKGAALLHAPENVTGSHEYRGIQLGMSSEEVRKKLGSPKEKAEDQDFFIFNETETAQILYDKTHKVVTISADYMKGGDAVPSAKDFLGSEPETKPDGSIYKLVRYPKAGFWLSYNRTAGSSPMVTITIQRIEQ
jgi:hypothetical protein